MRPLTSTRLREVAALRSINRFLLARLRPHVVKVGGVKLTVDADDVLGLLTRRFEVLQTDLATRLTPAGAIVVDAGAMVGYYTALFSQLVGERGRVYAFEAHPDNFALLEKNVTSNKLSNVTLFNQAVAQRSGVASLYVSPDAGHHRLEAPWGDVERIEVDTVAIDDVLTDGKVDVVKLDVEGAEAWALAGMRRLIERSPRLVLFVEFSPENLTGSGIDPRGFLDGLVDQGFELFVIDEDAKAVRPATPSGLCERYSAASDEHVNLLCVKGANAAALLNERGVTVPASRSPSSSAGRDVPSAPRGAARRGRTRPHASSSSASSRTA